MRNGLAALALAMCPVSHPPRSQRSPWRRRQAPSDPRRRAGARASRRELRAVGMEGGARHTVRAMLPAWARPRPDSSGNSGCASAGCSDGGLRGAPRRDRICRDRRCAMTASSSCWRWAGSSRLYEGDRRWCTPARRWFGGVRPRAPGASPRRTPPRFASISARRRARRRPPRCAGREHRHHAQGVRAPAERERPGARSTTASARWRSCWRSRPRRARLRHEVVFSWSVRRRRAGGARVAADALGLGAARVHAVYLRLGRLAARAARLRARADRRRRVIRAVDNSSSRCRPRSTRSWHSRARARIPLQIGATNGGNDGSAFAPWGVAQPADRLAAALLALAAEGSP